MLKPSSFLEYLEKCGVGFVTGVPDSLLAGFCAEVYGRYGVCNARHIVAANEGNAVAMAAGFYLSTGKYPLVYLQNSGLGNILNPAVSLTDRAVYGIPVIYVVGWRGEPGVHDEPQHAKQGSITLSLLDVLGIRSLVLDGGTTQASLEERTERELLPVLAEGGSVAFVVRKDTFASSGKPAFDNPNWPLPRERAVADLAGMMGKDDFVVSTTGKISRELFEYCKREKASFSSHTFLTVGSMGHAGAIALSVALQHREKRVWCFDGDGALLMHMGNMAVVGAAKPKNFIHVAFNNAAHESVGGMPTVAGKIDLCGAALACGYGCAVKVGTEQELLACKDRLREMSSPAFVEVFVGASSRKDLMRPDTTPSENKAAFMKALQC